jgi:hypothetical protein
MSVSLTAGLHLRRHPFRRRDGSALFRTTFPVVLVPLAALVFARVESADAATQIPATTYTQSTTWTVAGSPYVVNGDVTVGSGATLTIEPGVIVKFKYVFANPRKIIVAAGGTIDSAGTAAERIYFTSIKDDTIGGDTGGDGPTICQMADGGYVSVQSASPLNVIAYSTFRCGPYGQGKADAAIRVSGTGSALTVSDTEVSILHGSAIYVVGGTLTLARVSLSDFRSVGVMVGASGAATIDDATIVGRRPQSLAGHGVRAEDGTVSMSGSTLTDLEFGATINLSSTTPASASSFYDNTIKNNDYGVYLSSLPFGRPLPPMSQLPYGHRNNIYDNGGSSPNSNQLNAGGPTSEGLDWSDNYWGPDVYWFPNPPSCLLIGFPLGYVAYEWALPASPASPTKTTTQVVQPPGQQQSQYCTKTWADLGGEDGFARVPFEP